MSSNNQAAPEKTLVTLAGFGPPSFPGDYVFYLRKAEKKIRGYRAETGQLLLAQLDSSSSTSGDSGGPVYLRVDSSEPLILVGVISTKSSIEPISKYADWLKETMDSLR